MNMSVLRQVLETSVAQGESSATLCNEFCKAATLQHCKEHFKGSCLLQLVSQWHEQNVTKQDLPQQPFSLSWAFCTCNLFSGLFCVVVCYNKVQEYFETLYRILA